ncbi:hypothetical protein JCM3765_004585 [Sporobolomyces pararoseus]
MSFTRNNLNMSSYDNNKKRWTQRAIPSDFCSAPNLSRLTGASLQIHEQSSAEHHLEGGGTHVPSRDDLLHFLDSLSPRSSTLNTPTIQEQQQSVTGPSSTSLSVQSTPFAFENPELVSTSSLGFFFDPLVVSDDTNNNTINKQDSQVKPLSSSSTFSMNGKGFDAGDISMPFDLSLPPFDTILYPVLHQPTEKLPSTVPVGSGIDPVALDSTLDSPLALSQDASPWSDLLASPMFSLPNSGTVSETPLPPLDPSFDTPSSTEPVGSLFPPLPTPSSLYYDTNSTTLRPLPPIPVRPDLAPLQQPVSSPSSASMTLPTPPLLPSRSTSSSDIKPKRQGRPEPTGFRTTIPLLDLDAPIQTRNPVVASSTSRKRKTAGALKALAKKRARQEISPTPVAESVSGGGDPVDPEELPADIAAQVERKRLQNTLSARKSRARKQAKMQELEEENRLLAEENARLKAQLEALLGPQ